QDPAVVQRSLDFERPGGASLQATIDDVRDTQHGSSCGTQVPCRPVGPRRQRRSPRRAGTSRPRWPTRSRSHLHPRPCSRSNTFGYTQFAAATADGSRSTTVTMSLQRTQHAVGWPLAVFQALRTAEARAAAAARARYATSRIGSLEPERGERAAGDAPSLQGVPAGLLIARSDEARFARAGVALVQDGELHVGRERAEAV